MDFPDLYYLREIKMVKKSVRKRIFMSNALTVFVTLAIVLVFNLLMIKGYWEGIESQWQLSVEQMGEVPVTALIESWTIHRNGFYFMLAWDAVFCILTLAAVSSFFTGRLIRHVTEPLNALEMGIERIRRGDLQTPVSYHGDREFETVCEAFNEMQIHILQEQEKNRKYEKARIDMVAGISHDLRTPLTAIRGTIKGLLDGIVSTPEQQKKFLTVAYTRTGDMECLLRQLLELSKLETGNLPLNLYQISLSAFLKQYEAEKEAVLEKGRECFVAELPQEEIFIRTDPEQLHRILDNLFENSRKYSQTETLLMRLKLYRKNGEAELIFSDNGIGVPEEKLPYVFDEFYRADESRNTKGGNGLGLYIVKCLAEAMDGRVFAESRNGFAVHMIFHESEE